MSRVHVHVHACSEAKYMDVINELGITVQHLQHCIKLEQRAQICSWQLLYEAL